MWGPTEAGPHADQVIEAIAVAIPVGRSSFAPYSDRPLIASENAFSGRYASTLLIWLANVIAPGYPAVIR